MKRLPRVLGGILFLWCVCALVHGTAASTDPPDDPSRLPNLRSLDRTASEPAPPDQGLSRAVGDTVYLLGGPGSLSGKFQTMISWPGGNPDAQGWTGVDITEPDIYWRVSTFNAAAFGGPVTPNHAIWSGVPAGTPGYVAAPGYGNNWDDNLVFTRTINGTVANTARLQFQFNYDTETNWDWFYVDYDSAGVWTNIQSYTGISDTTGTFVTPAIFDETVTLDPGMGGAAGNQLRLRLRFVSDGNTSDEDGGVDTQGAVQIDNIRVTLNSAVISYAEFEGGEDDADWVIVKGDYVGEFAKLFVQFEDIDPCRSNVTPCFGFIDTGAEPSNAPGETTGGALSSNWDYGIPGGWVVNYTGGLAGNGYQLHNEIWSPEIDWDLPGTDDDLAVGGAILRTTVWEHLPLGNCGAIWYWGVRTYRDATGEWTLWADHLDWFYAPIPRYNNFEEDISDLIGDSPDKVQIALGVWDITGFYPNLGGDATPSPLFDNVALLRYRVAGPAISFELLNFFQDAFPQSGATYASATDSLDLAIRLDRCGDLVRTQGDAIVAGDSMVIVATPVVPGTTLASPPEMVWVLDANPLFDDARTLPAGSSLLGTFTGPDGRTWDRWTGVVVGQESTNNAGNPIDDTYWFDLPDGRARRGIAEPDEPGMFYPADELRWYFRAEDTLGNVSTSPDDLDLATFQNGTWGDDGRTYEVHGLPSYVDPTGTGLTITHPNILYINDFGHRGNGEEMFLQAFHQNGMFETVDWDCYTVIRPDAEQSNGIGSAGSWGATADQLDGYDIIVYDAGDLAGLSDGTQGENKSPDVVVLRNWKDRPGNRFTVHFGDNIASSLAVAETDALTYMSTVMGVDFTGPDMRSSIGGQTIPVAAPAGDVPGFSSKFIAHGGCLAINEFDHIGPIAAAKTAHEFTTREGLTGVYDPSASVWYDRTTTTGRKVDVTFPFGLQFLWNPPVDDDDDVKSAAATLFAELFTAFGMTIDDGDATGSNPPALPSRLLGNHPNPFNPSTEIDLRMGVVGKFTLRIYNVRGELVRTLLNEEMKPGTRSITWDGTDHQGRLVGSGVYLTKFTGPDVSDAGKILLIK